MRSALQRSPRTRALRPPAAVQATEVSTPSPALTVQRMAGNNAFNAAARSTSATAAHVASTRAGNWGQPSGPTSTPASTETPWQSTESAVVGGGQSANATTVAPPPAPSRASVGFRVVSSEDERVAEK